MTTGDGKQKCSIPAVWCVLSVFHNVMKAALFSAQRLQYAFLEAAGKGDLDRMKHLIEQGCSVNARNQVKFPCALIQSWSNIQYVTQITYIFLQACRVGYLRVAMQKYVARCPHSNMQIVSGSIYAMWKMSVNECAIIRTQSMTGIGCWRNILEVRLVLRLSFEPGQPFCHTQPVKGNMLQVYIRKPPVTAFDANILYTIETIN